jgi:pantoate--beta-alanine ligase
VLTSVREMREYSDRVKSEGKTIGLVPTMGFLHEGHLSLIRQAKVSTDVVVVSIFVNPTQFGVGEDFDEYPRSMEKDTAACLREGVDVIFAPTAEEMYPSPYLTYVNVEKITERLCGKSRPGHFRGVATVVNKLFNIVAPDKAFFGQKDAQQLIVIRRMVKDLNMRIKVIPVPIVREPDGVAMSSRNKYLSPQERQSAKCLNRALLHAKELISGGERDSARIVDAMRKIIENEQLAQVDYIEIFDADSLEEISRVEGNVLIALAVKFGSARLIDNMVVNVEG